MTGQESAKTVTATIKRLASAVVSVSVTDAKTGQAETLTCTPEHPLFVVGQGWVEAGSLGIGSSIVSRAGPLLSVQSVTWQRAETQASSDPSSANAASLASKPFTVYNLTVEDDHTYFVGTVGGGTWVHNELCPVKINWFRQGRHIVDHPDYTDPGRSILTEDPEAMLSEAGSGTPANSITPGEAGYKERINFDRIVGIYKNVEGTLEEPTTNALAHYGKNGIHFVPARP